MKQDEWRVSVWVGFKRPDPNVDILNRICGVKYYDVDFQEFIVDDDQWKPQSIEKLLKELSYSSSFLSEALDAAKSKGIDESLYVLAQFKLAYSPRKNKPVASDPMFLGCFTWNDDESAERYKEYLAAIARAKKRSDAK